MADLLQKLHEEIAKVARGAKCDEATAGLLSAGSEKIAKKVVEESAKVSLAYVQGNTDDVVRETADLFYNLLVLLVERGIPLEDIWREMSSREEVLGIAGKVPKEFQDDVAQQLIDADD